MLEILPIPNVDINTVTLFVVIKDDEWRFVGEPGTIADQSNTVGIDRHPYPDMSLLVGSFKLDSVREATLKLFEGPNILRARSNGYFEDDNFGANDVYSTTASYTIKFDCDKNDGTITPQAGPTSGPSNGSDPPLSVIVKSATPRHINGTDVHTVSIQFEGDAGVKGSWGWATGVSYVVGLSFTGTEDWSDHAGSPFSAIGNIKCGKGADN